MNTKSETIDDKKSRESFIKNSLLNSYNNSWHSYLSKNLTRAGKKEVADFSKRLVHLDLNTIERYIRIESQKVPLETPNNQPAAIRQAKLETALEMFYVKREIEEIQKDRQEPQSNLTLKYAEKKQKAYIHAEEAVYGPTPEYMLLNLRGIEEKVRPEFSAKTEEQLKTELNTLSRINGKEEKVTSYLCNMARISTISKLLIDKRYERIISTLEIINQ